MVSVCSAKRHAVTKLKRDEPERLAAAKLKRAEPERHAATKLKRAERICPTLPAFGPPPSSHATSPYNA
ncbi:hypothetical protein T492DRAFT_910661 [Pavlovales sp. CCMP2436]|nr:hypothetical protein T492DRAFT_910661 [Pavlovales sp. CCMP2436]